MLLAGWLPLCSEKTRSFGLEIGMASNETYGPIRHVSVVRERVSIGKGSIVSQRVRRGYDHETSAHRAASIFPKTRLCPRAASRIVELTAQHRFATRAPQTWIERLLPSPLVDSQGSTCRQGGGEHRSGSAVNIAQDKAL
jgi:hypothetical protein